MHGLGLGGTLLAFSAGIPGCTSDEGLSPANYPPLRTGLRGLHPGSYEAAHDLVKEKLSIKLPLETDEQYDLVVVGAGVSGLAAAHFYRKRFGTGAKFFYWITTTISEGMPNAMSFIMLGTRVSRLAVRSTLRIGFLLGYPMI